MHIFMGVLAPHDRAYSREACAWSRSSCTSDNTNCFSALAPLIPLMFLERAVRHGNAVACAFPSRVLTRRLRGLGPFRRGFVRALRPTTPLRPTGTRIEWGWRCYATAPSHCISTFHLPTTHAHRPLLNRIPRKWDGAICGLRRASPGSGWAGCGAGLEGAPA